jgi:hypothetical protein
MTSLGILVVCSVPVFYFVFLRIYAMRFEKAQATPVTAQGQYDQLAAKK